MFVGEADITALDPRGAAPGATAHRHDLPAVQPAAERDRVRQRRVPAGLQAGHGSGEVRRRVRECLEVVGLLDKIDSYPAQLSGGQKQRVAIARALAPRPAVLLCDEPTSALDAETTRSVLDTLRTIHRDLGVTVLIVTHELAVVRTLCRTVAVMEHGAIAEQFAVADAAAGCAPRRTALGRELARMAVYADLQLDLARSMRLASEAAPPSTCLDGTPMSSNLVAILPELWVAIGQTALCWRSD